MDTENQKTSGEIKNSEYKELVDFLGVKFENLDQKFENIDRKFENIDRKFDEVNAKIDAVKADVREVSARLGSKIDDYHADQIGMRRDIDRHEKWHFKVADKVGVDLRAN
ncbi:MAG: hypothetical protein WCX69_02140 [Candidatus Paceibacterota bacterium]